MSQLQEKTLSMAHGHKKKHNSHASSVLFGRLLRIVTAIIVTMMFLFTAYVNAQVPSEWKLAKEVSQVKFYYLVADCGGSSTVFVKVVNEGPVTVNGTWTMEVEGDGPKSMFTGVLVPLRPGESIESSCDRRSPDLSFPVQRSESATGLKVSLSAKIRQL
jgi:hypothetical protein